MNEYITTITNIPICVNSIDSTQDCVYTCTVLWQYKIRTVELWKGTGESQMKHRQEQNLQKVPMDKERDLEITDQHHN